VLVQIFRVECPKRKLGPYVSRPFSISWQKQYHSQLPNPKQEGLDITKEWLCAFESLEKLNSWFLPEELEALHQMGFKLLTGFVHENEIQFGERQLIYRKEMLEDFKYKSLRGAKK
jgi:hypothetical protein